MKRRSFFAVPAAAAAGVSILPSEARAAAPVVIRTAITLRIAIQYEGDSWKDGNMARTEDLELPEGFHPCAISMNLDSWLSVRLFDDTGDVVSLADEAFRHGPVDFWREPTGPMKVEVWCDGCPSVAPLATVVIYGQIDA